MKRIMVLLICIILTAFAVCGCASGSGSGSADSVSDDSVEAIVSEYVKPADYIQIDMDAADPSSDQIKFEFDSEGRVTECRYKIGDDDTYVSYQYNGSNVQIYAFIGDIVVADEIVTIPDGEAQASGFISVNGYYFRAVK